MHKDAVNEFFKVKRKRFYSCKHKNQSHQSHTSLVSRAFPYGYTPQGCDFFSVSVFLWLFVCLLKGTTELTSRTSKKIKFNNPNRQEPTTISSINFNTEFNLLRSSITYS